MTINPVFIGKEQLDDLEALRTLAAERPVSMPGLTERLKNPTNKRRHMKQMSAQTIHVPNDYYVTLSLETGHPAGTCRHMSMSSGRPKHVPIPEAVWMVAENLGFVGGLDQCHVWLEDVWDRPGQKAVNIVQPIAGTEAARAKENPAAGRALCGPGGV